jgi:glycosyltransferase involved in cell wall biosynthesis
MPAILASLAGWRGTVFDLAVVSRLRLMPVWQALVGQARMQAHRAVLDLDDIESLAYERIVRILGAERLGDAGMAREIDECRKLAQAEATAHAVFDQVVVCSRLDREKLAARFGQGRAAVVPNAVRLAESAARPAPSASPGHLLFVGSLDYVPNADAVTWLAGEILPAIAAATRDNALRLLVVGRRPVDWIQQMAARGAFELFANVPDVAPYYAGALAALVPIRAGGGTRIKILEAMAHGVPVISTRLGAEGLAASDGDNILLAETAAEFSAAVLRLRGEAGLADQIASNARRFVEAAHSPAAFAAAVKAVAS